MANDVKELFCDVSFVLKFVVLILCCVSAFFVTEHTLSWYMDANAEEVVMVVLLGYIVVTGVMLIIYIFDEPHKLYECILLITGGVLGIIAGILCIIAYCDYDKGPGRRNGNWDGNDYGRSVTRNSGKGRGIYIDVNDNNGSNAHRGSNSHAIDRIIVGVLALAVGIIMLVDGILSAIKYSK